MKKMIVVPFKENAENCTERLKHELNNILHIALKLKSADTFDDRLRIKVESKGIEKTNILDYLTSLTNNISKLPYEDVFVDQLYKAKIDPELIDNNSIRTKLLGKMKNGAILYTKVSPVEIKANKRKHKNRAWIYP